MFIQQFLSSSGLPMRFKSATPADCEQLARTCHSVVGPANVRMALAMDAARREAHPYRKGKTAKDRDHVRPAKARAK